MRHLLIFCAASAIFLSCKTRESNSLSSGTLTATQLSSIKACEQMEQETEKLLQEGKKEEASRRISELLNMPPEGPRAAGLLVVAAVNHGEKEDVVSLAEKHGIPEECNGACETGIERAALTGTQQSAKEGHFTPTSEMLGKTRVEAAASATAGGKAAWAGAARIYAAGFAAAGNYSQAIEALGLASRLAVSAEALARSQKVDLPKEGLYGDTLENGDRAVDQLAQEAKQSAGAKNPAEIEARAALVKMEGKAQELLVAQQYGDQAKAGQLAGVLGRDPAGLKVLGSVLATQAVEVVVGRRDYRGDAKKYLAELEKSVRGLGGGLSAASKVVAQARHGLGTSDQKILEQELYDLGSRAARALEGLKSGKVTGPLAPYLGSNQLSQRLGTNVDTLIRAVKR